jgi:hypothetical protein
MPANSAESALALASPARCTGSRHSTGAPVRGRAGLHTGTGLRDGFKKPAAVADDHIQAYRTWRIYAQADPGPSPNPPAGAPI